MSETNNIRIATRGSALALAQANMIFAHCRKAFPRLNFEIKIVKTTGDRLQSKGVQPGQALPKGLFTKELEVELVKNRADLAVHKDRPRRLDLEQAAAVEHAENDAVAAAMRKEERRTARRMAPRPR